MSPIRTIQMTLIFSLLVNGLCAFAANKSLDPKFLRQVVRSNLQFISSEQVQAPNNYYVSGEWPTRIQSTVLPVALGVGKLIGTNQEASAFTTASVVNALASLYLEHPEMHQDAEFQMIPLSIARAVPSFERYREGDLFNFYPPLIWKGVRIHQPIAMTLIDAWKGFTNIPQDADTSSVVHSALLYHSLIQGEFYQVPQATMESFERFRDQNRKSHFYNRRENRQETGAFMTWQMDENDPRMPRYWFAAPEEGVRIPFNRNDVDCIVNLNVLRMMSLNRSTPNEGHHKACAMINDMINKKEHATCGIYYPNSFQLAYSAAQLQKTGDSCLKAERKKDLVQFILKNQNADGSWDNVGNPWNDQVQATAFAMTALLEFGDWNDHGLRTSLQYGTEFLLSRLEKPRRGPWHWKGETFFTATAIARSLVIWKSNSYTTAVAAGALLKMAQRLD